MEQLNKKNSNNPFLVPDGYFEHLPEEVMDKIHKQQRKKIIKNIIFSVAAVILLVIGINLFFIFQKEQPALFVNNVDNQKLIKPEHIAQEPSINFEQANLQPIDYQIMDSYTIEYVQEEYLY